MLSAVRVRELADAVDQARAVARFVERTLRRGHLNSGEAALVRAELDALREQLGAVSQILTETEVTLWTRTRPRKT